MNPPPPMLPALGCVTASANAVATAASTALPPFLQDRRADVRRRGRGRDHHAVARRDGLGLRLLRPPRARRDDDRDSGDEQADRAGHLATDSEHGDLGVAAARRGSFAKYRELACQPRRRVTESIHRPARPGLSKDPPVGQLGMPASSADPPPWSPPCQRTAAISSRPQPSPRARSGSRRCLASRQRRPRSRFPPAAVASSARRRRSAS